MRAGPALGRSRGRRPGPSTRHGFVRPDQRGRWHACRLPHLVRRPRNWQAAPAPRPPRRPQRSPLGPGPSQTAIRAGHRPDMSANRPAPLTRTADGVDAAATRGINLRRLARYAERSVIRSPRDQIASSCHAAVSAQPIIPLSNARPVPASKAARVRPTTAFRAPAVSAPPVADVGADGAVSTSSAVMTRRRGEQRFGLSGLCLGAVRRGGLGGSG